MVRDRLVAMRRAKALSQEDVAYRTGRSRTTVSRWEVGDMSPGPAARRALAQLYDCTLDELDDAIESNGADPMPVVSAGWWSNYEAFEQSATSLRTWEPMVVPGLLQIEAYARVLLRNDELVTRRMARQTLVTRDDNPVELTAVVDESVLLRPVGGRDVLADQLRQLLTMADRPNVTIRVLPLDAAEVAIAIGGKGAFVILTPTWPGGLVHREYQGGAHSLDSHHDIENHLAAFDELLNLALSPADSRDLIRRRLEELDP